MQIDRLSPAQWQRYRTIRLASLQESSDAFGSTLADAQARPDHNWRRQVTELPTFLAAADGRDIGVVRGSIDADDPSQAFLLSMWVDPQHRRRGAARCLIQAVIDWARSENATHLTLDVADNNLPAVKLYADLGFEPNGDVGALEAPRQHITEHRRVLLL